MTGNTSLGVGWSGSASPGLAAGMHAMPKDASNWTVLEVGSLQEEEPYCHSPADLPTVVGEVVAADHWVLDDVAENKPSGVKVEVDRSPGRRSVWGCYAGSASAPALEQCMPGAE
jgi:hypothetical protein